LKNFILIAFTFLFLACQNREINKQKTQDIKQAVSDLCFGQMVSIQGQKYDYYKRLIAVVINHNKQMMNQEMIKLSMAWHFKKYSNDPLYVQLEINARKNKIDLWQDRSAVAPW